MTNAGQPPSKLIGNSPSATQHKNCGLSPNSPVQMKSGTWVPLFICEAFLIFKPWENVAQEFLDNIRASEAKPIQVLDSKDDNK